MSKENHYRSLFDEHKFEFPQQSAQGELQFLHGEPHADAVSRTNAEWKVRVRIAVLFNSRIPPVVDGMPPTENGYGK